MKQLDFGKGFINESKNEPEMINEFLGTLLVCGVLGVVGSTAALNVFKNISGLYTDLVKLRNERMQAKSERMKAKLEREKIKQEYLLTKLGFKEKDTESKDSGSKTKDKSKSNFDDFDWDVEEKKQMDDKVDEIQSQQNDVLKRMMAYENAINTLQDGADKEKHQANLELMIKSANGSASTDEIKQLDELSKKSLSPDEQKIADEVEKSTEKISNEDLEKWKSEKGITNDGFIKTVNTVNDKDPNLLEPSKNDGNEPTGDESTKNDGEDKTEPDEFKDPDGTVYKKDENGKCTMTTKDGDSTEIKPEEFDAQKKANIEEDDPQKDDERVDNDDDIEDLDYSNKDDLAKDPSTKYKQRTYKRGNKTFRTKSYYDKKGNSISKDDFMKMKQSYEERQAAKKDKKGKKKDEKNESFVGTPWTTTRLCETKKPAPVMEAEQGSDMETICKERLVYIKFVMDTTTNNVEKVKMERMYNAIYNCCFDSNGKPRTMEDLYTYLNETMIENKGEIPGLPTNDQVVNIDDKCKAWRKTSPDKFDAYMAQLNKENLDKTGTKKTDKAKDLLSPDKPDSNTEALDKIRSLSTKYGFTNILGLEPTRQASKDDDDKKDEVNKQQKDGSPDANAKDSKDVKADDVSPEQVDKIIGVSK